MKDSMQLDASVKALREQLSSGEPTLTRQRVLTSLVKMRQRRQRMMLALLLAGTFVCGSTAAAWFTGELPRLVDQLAAAFASERPHQTRKAALDDKPKNMVVPTPKSAAADAVASEVVTTTKTVAGGTKNAEVPSPVDTIEVKNHEKREKAAEAVSRPTPTPEREQALYQYAHRKHFVENDYPAAVRAWDAYLALAPRGQLLPEARYNRAIALVRVGRLREAAQALQPFAFGEYGEYRRKEASKLLSRIHAELANEK
jgi:hypothetical protein